MTKKKISAILYIVGTLLLAAASYLAGAGFDFAKVFGDVKQGVEQYQQDVPETQTLPQGAANG